MRGVGQGEKKQIQDSIRRDEVCWLERENATPAQKLLWSNFDELKITINRTLFLGLKDFEGHYAAYPAGGFYQRHLDSFTQDQSRTISIVLYLNPNWKKPDGGELRIYKKDSFIDVEPVAGTLVCFLSREVEHEVLPSATERLSFAGWLRS